MYYQVLITRKVVLKLRLYYEVFIARKVVLKLRYVLSSVHCKESCFKVPACIIQCSLQGQLI